MTGETAPQDGSRSRMCVDTSEARPRESFGVGIRLSCIETSYCTEQISADAPSLGKSVAGCDSRHVQRGHGARYTYDQPFRTLLDESRGLMM
jgi:hypothetical protein